MIRDIHGWKNPISKETFCALGDVYNHRDRRAFPIFNRNRREIPEDAIQRGDDEYKRRKEKKFALYKSH